MTKQEQFLWIVQTAIIANSINLASRLPDSESYRHVFSATGALSLADEAIDASERIPENMTACEAANDFCTYMFENLRDIENKAGNTMQVPHWFARS
ncbi:MAG: hypothetical protein ACM3JB_16945 [Acidobacteriaceae bacterium]